MSKSHPVPFITGKRVDALQGKSLRDIPEIEVFLNDLSGSTDKFSIDNARSLLDLPYNKTSITALMLGMHG